MKRMTTFILSFVVLLSLVGCGSSGNTSTAGSSDTTGDTNVTGEASTGGEGARTAGGTVVDGDPGTGQYTVASARGDVYVQEFEPTYKQPNNPGTVVMYTNKLAYLDPAFSSQTEHGWCYNVYEPLFQQSNEGDGELEPVLATDWYYDDEGNFHAILREGVKFHSPDGAEREMTAKDVLYSIGRVVNSPTSPAYSGMQGVDVENSYAEDDYHVVIVFKNPVGGFINYMSSSWLSIVDSEFFEQAGDDYDWWNNSAGTGAYYVTETVSGLSQTFERFDDYWGGKPVMKTIVLQSQIESTVMGIELEAGNFDIGLQSNIDSINSVLDGTVQGLDYLLLSTHRGFIIWPSINPESKALSNYEVREALSLSINREYLTVAIYGDETMAYASDRQMIDGITCFDPQYDPDKAREIMSGLGYSESNPCVLQFMTSKTTAQQTCLEAVQAMANECYFDVQVTITASGVITEDEHSTEYPSKWDGLLAGFQQYVDAEIYYANCDAYEKEIGEYSGLKANFDPEFSRLFNLLPVTTDQEERNGYIDELNQLYSDNLYFIPLLIIRQPALVQNYLQNVRFRDGMGIIWKDLQYKDWVEYTP